MNNEKYKLNISDKEVELFSKFLWYWNPKECNIWFIWNEITEEKHLEFKKKDSLDDEYYYTDSLKSEKIEWKWNKIIDWIAKRLNKNIDDLFVGDFYFLPTSSWNNLFGIYGWVEPKKININEWESYYDRLSYYKSNGLYKLLKERVKILFSIFNENTKIIIFWDIINKKEILKDLKIKNNNILFTPFITSEKFETDKVINFINN